MVLQKYSLFDSNATPHPLKARQIKQIYKTISQTIPSQAKKNIENASFTVHSRSSPRHCRSKLIVLVGERTFLFGNLIEMIFFTVNLAHGQPAYVNW